LLLPAAAALAALDTSTSPCALLLPLLLPALNEPRELLPVPELLLSKPLSALPHLLALLLLLLALVLVVLLSLFVALLLLLLLLLLLPVIAAVLLLLLPNSF
jgi:hypothetical protein